MGELYARLFQERSGLRAFNMLVNYLFEARGECVTDTGLRTLCARAHASPEVEESVMNLAEKLRAEGRQEGREEGMRDGLVRLLRLRFGEVDGATLARIRDADLPTLEHWLDRFVGARTLAEVLR